MSIMIEVKDVVKTYKLYKKPTDRLKESVFPTKKQYHENFNALNGISFEINKGDALGILGRNGSGKSTLLKLITGVLSASSGTIKVNGRMSAILELGAGFNPEYTGRENIYLNGLMIGLNRSEIDTKMDEIIEFADIGSFIDQPVKIYSSGMFARLAFAVAINVDPDILIVDEALAVGDVRFQMKCIEKMKELKAGGTTILFVSHATEQVKRFCNRAVWLKDGVIEAIGESSEIVDLYEDYMKYSSGDNGESNMKIVDSKVDDEIDTDMILPSNPDIVASITQVNINETKFKTFDQVEVQVEYEIYDKIIHGLLLGVALYTPDRQYIFGPNTYLEKIDVPNRHGRHKVKYVIPRLPLLGGTYNIDVGIFNNEGIVCLDYKQEAAGFTVVNKYFSEGLVYIEHNWEVLR